METTSGQGSESSFKELLEVMWRQKWVLATTICVALVLAVAFIFVVEPAYQCSMRIIVEGRSSANQPYLNNRDPMATLALSPSDDVPTQIEQIQSRSILLEALQSVVQADPSLRPKEDTDVTVTARQIGATNGVEIFVTSPSRALSQQIAAQIPKTYRGIFQDRNSGQLQSGIAFLTKQIEIQQDALSIAEKDLEAFRKKNDLSASSTEAADRSGQSLMADRELNLARAEFEGSKKAYESLVAARKVLPARILSPSIEENVGQRQQVRDRLEQLEAKRQSLLELYTSDAREIKEADAEIEKTRTYLRNMPPTITDGRGIRNPLIDSYDQQVAQAKASMLASKARLEERTQFSIQAKRKLAEFSTAVSELSRLQRDIETKSANVNQLTEQLNSLKLFLNQVNEPIQVIQEPSEALQSRPNPPLYVAIALLVGSVLAGAIALAKERLEDRVSNLDQAFRISGVPALGYVPAVENSGRKLLPGGPKALTGRFRENYRVVRSNVLFSLKEGEEKSVIVTSTGANEGSADVAANLSVAMAASGRKTIFVDANLNQPSQHIRFGTDMMVGLSNVLAGTVSLKDVISTTGTENLSFISAGATDLASGDLLGSEHMENILRELSTLYDLIVLDSPPMTLRSDTLALSAIADTLVYVVRPGVATKSSMRYCIDLLQHTRSRMLGLIITDTSFIPE